MKMSGTEAKFEAPPAAVTPKRGDDFVEPRRAIMNVFDINKWYKSEVCYFCCCLFYVKEFCFRQL